MDVAFLEGLAVATYEEAGRDPADPISMFRLARLLHGPDAIVRAASMMSNAANFKHHGKHRFALKAGLSPQRSNHVLGHELGHPILAREGYTEPDLELACDYLGGALMAPRPAVRQLRFSFGDDYQEISEAVCATHTWAALRVAEVTRTPTVVVAPHSVRVRGAEWGWPESEDQIRRLAKRPVHGVRLVRLTDERRRVVMTAEDVQAA